MTLNLIMPRYHREGFEPKMLKYGITDLRMFFENDVRFLKHFGF